MKHNKNLMTRREALKRAVTLCAGTLAAPMLNRERYRVFASSPNEYSARAIDLVNRSTVIDMLSPLTLNFPISNICSIISTTWRS
jgi:hypothetical protein